MPKNLASPLLTMGKIERGILNRKKRDCFISAKKSVSPRPFSSREKLDYKKRRGTQLYLETISPAEVPSMDIVLRAIDP